MGGPAMKMMLYHLSGTLRGRTQYFDTDSISFGIGEGCCILTDAARGSMMSPVHAELTVENQTPIMRDRSGQNALLINGRRAAEAALQDGDLIQLGDDGPLLRFRLQPNQTRESKPWRYIVADSRDIVVRTPYRRYMSSLYLARHILGDIARYGSPIVKVVAAISILAPILIIATLAVALYHQYSAAGASERRISELVSQLETGRLTQAELETRTAQERQTIAELRGQQEDLREKLRASLRELEAGRRSQQALAAIRRKLSELEGSHRFAEEIIGRVERSVGLLQGGYGFKEKKSGLPLRYREFDEEGNALLDEEGNPLVTIKGSAPRVVIFYAGTGFLIDKRGTILTNRHIVRMWEAYEPVQELLQAGYEPDPYVFRIFFPGTPEPYELEILGISDRVDLAVLRIHQPPTGIKPLKLAPPDKTVRVGEPVIVLSYPGTFDGILSRLPLPTSMKLLQEVGSDPLKLPEALSRQRLIRPLATQGHVSDVSPNVITYEARSASGSSGGPVLDRAGRVIAVNHSILQRIEGVNLGVPIQFVRAELAQLKAARDSRGPSSSAHP